jgi:hypothetical protein
MGPALRLILVVLSTVLSACTTAPPAAFTADLSDQSVATH